MPAAHGLDALKAHAKSLLALARSGDVTVIATLRAQLPALARRSDAAIAASVKLADVHHALARQRGLENWSALKHRIQSADPVAVQAERFLQAVREADGTRAGELLAAHPAIVNHSAHAAAAACNAEALATLLARDAALATRVAPPDNGEPLIYACMSPLQRINAECARGNRRCVELLLEHGANANASTPAGDATAPGEARLSALYHACVTNNVAAVSLLLEHGAETDDGESVYHAAERNHRACLELLLAHGANISNRHPHWDNTPLYFLAGYKATNPAAATAALGMRWLLEHGADPSIPSGVGERSHPLPSRGELPLHRIAATGGSVEIARALVEHGANVDAPRGDGRTAYALAVRTGNTAVAAYLATIGAATNGLSAIDRLLGACVIADAETAREIARVHPDLLSSLTAEDHQALVLVAEEGKEDSVRLMVSLGWSLEQEGAWGGTPLHHAAWHGQRNMARLLIALGAPVNVRDRTFGSSPLAWAAHGSVHAHPGHDEDYCAVIDMLLDAGSMREASYNKWNEAPESLSSRRVARLLKQRGFTA